MIQDMLRLPEEDRQVSNRISKMNHFSEKLLETTDVSRSQSQSYLETVPEEGETNLSAFGGRSGRNDSNNNGSESVSSEVI